MRLFFQNVNKWQPCTSLCEILGFFEHAQTFTILVEFLCNLFVYLSNSEEAGDKDHRTLFDEITLMRNLNHKHIIQLLAWGYHDGRACMVMEYMDGGDLLTFLRRNLPNRTAAEGELTPFDLMNISYQICQGMAYLSASLVSDRNCRFSQKT